MNTQSQTSESAECLRATVSFTEVLAGAAFIFLAAAIPVGTLWGIIFGPITHGFRDNAPRWLAPYEQHTQIGLLALSLILAIPIAIRAFRIAPPHFSSAQRVFGFFAVYMAYVLAIFSLPFVVLLLFAMAGTFLDKIPKSGSGPGLPTGPAYLLLGLAALVAGAFTMWRLLFALPKLLTIIILHQRSQKELMSRARKPPSA